MTIDQLLAELERQLAARRERKMGDCKVVPVADYEALQAECEKLRSKTRISLGVGDGDGSLFVHGDYDSIKRVQALIFECEKLRMDAERYQSLLEAVLREIPHREGIRGNAPGHGHSVPGVWDYDNGALAGKECAWCKVWNEALTAMQSGRST